MPNIADEARDRLLSERTLERWESIEASHARVTSGEASGGTSEPLPAAYVSHGPLGRAAFGGVSDYSPIGGAGSGAEGPVFDELEVADWRREAEFYRTGGLNSWVVRRLQAWEQSDGIGSVREFLDGGFASREAQAFMQIVLELDGVERCSECGVPHLGGREVYDGGRVCAVHDYLYNADGRHFGDDDDFGGLLMPILSYSADPMQYLGFKSLPDEGRVMGKAGKKAVDGLIHQTDYPYLGVELEVVVRDSAVGEVGFEKVAHEVWKAVQGNAILKHDGSVQQGFEIVTAPGTHGWHKSGVWNPLWESNGGPAKWLKAWNTSCCGVHVHVSKKCLTPLDVAKLAQFVNVGESFEFCLRFAGRKGNQYCQQDTGYVVGKLGTVSRQKYMMLNVGKLDTVEFRMFRGNISEWGVLRNVDFCQALVEWVKIAGLRDVGSVMGFCGYVASERSRFLHLWSWLVEHGYLEGKISNEVRKLVGGNV